METTPADTYRLLNTLSEAFHTIRTESATPISDEKLIASALEGMLSLWILFLIILTPSIIRI